ncbi:MAG TPA: hypothetical protein PKD54_14090, partial [Pirellulaceae bacterium]|nr:hypothetical protein [Pirellulaceae bacterium]
EPSEAASAEHRTSARSSAPWAMRIRGVYELNPLACPQCGGQMVVVAFIEPPQREVIERILKHCGLWRSWAARPPPAHSTGDGPAFANRSDGEPQELTYVDMDTFLATF